MVCVGLEDGTMGQLMLGKAEIERSMSLIAEIAPWATLGYSEETAALFRQSPKALLRFLPV